MNKTGYSIDVPRNKDLSISRQFLREIMELSGLKKLRKIVPGTTFLFFSIPAYQFITDQTLNIDDTLKFALEGYGAVIAFIIGTLFSSLKIRSKRNAKTHQEIVDNIKTKLIEHGLTVEQSPENIDKVKASKQLMHVFYQLIDNDKSLKEKSKLVRENGLTWTSTADIAILSCLFCWIYFTLIIIFGPISILVTAGLMIGCIGLLSGAVLHPNSVKEHIKLGNEQIDFIVTNHKNKLQKKVTGLFNKIE